MCKLISMLFLLTTSIALIQSGLCSSKLEDKKNLPPIKKVFKALGGKNKSKKEAPPAPDDGKELSVQDVLTVLKGKGALSSSSRISKVLDTGETALSAKQIIFIEDENHRPYVIKRFKTQAAFLEEANELEKVNQDIMPLVKKIKADLGWKYDFPTITTGKPFPNIDRIGVVVLETGVGGTLYDSIVQKLSTMADSKIIEVFTSIGGQSGNLDKVFYSYFKKILLHGDSHARNFTYDDFTKILYWIDTTSMTLSDKRSNKKDRLTGIDRLEFLYQIAGSKETNDQLEEWLKKAKEFQAAEHVTDILSLSKDAKKKLEEELQKIKAARAKEMLAIESFKNEYISKNPDQKKDCEDSIATILTSIDAGTVDTKLQNAIASMQHKVTHQLPPLPPLPQHPASSMQPKAPHQLPSLPPHPVSR